MKTLELSSHPRLWFGRRELERLREAPSLPILVAAEGLVRQQAEQYVKSPVFDWPVNTHNAHLIRARTNQDRILTLLVRYAQTGNERFRRAVLEHVGEMGRWEYWSWIAWRQQDRRADAIFDLSYGENSATLALAYDWLYDSLSASERRLFLDPARGRAFKAFLTHCERKDKAWWFGKKDCNWNTVCAGGGGMLALAMHDELPEAARVLALAEASVRSYMRYLNATGGGWPEGVGYWNYGMYYAFMYLLSWERATGRKHPLLGAPAVRATLSFPLDFSPNGVPSGFGDSNAWRPMPFHYAIAERLGCHGVLAALDRLDSIAGLRSSPWAGAAQLLLLHPRRPPGRVQEQRHVARLYRGQDWAILADRMPDPGIYLSLRGGTTEVPHGHMDLTSFQCVVGDEQLISDLPAGEYLDTTFGPRRYELPEMTPGGKNVVLVNGVGVARPSSVKTEKLAVGGRPAFRIDATEAMGRMLDGPLMRFRGRLWVLLRSGSVLIVDGCLLRQFGRVESRLHSFARVRFGKTAAVISGKRRRLSASFACTVPAKLHQAIDALTNPGRAPTMIRWCTNGLHLQVAMAMLLSPSARPGKLSLVQNHGSLTILAGGERIVLSDRLRPLRARG